MSNSGRPLSPHLSIYRWPITMTLSILHRATGIALSLGLVVLVLWLVHAASGPEQYQVFRDAMSTPFAIVMLVGWTFAFFLHLANGVRHLVWDTGHGLEKKQADATAWIALVFAVVITILAWLLAL